jgi:membrane-bound inhibitor of C-type lysozyme
MWLVVIAVVAVMFAVAFVHKRNSRKAAPAETPIASATYTCDAGKTLAATYYAGTPVTVAPGERPVPTGWAMVSIDGGPEVRLSQTLSADGARYANADESLVFWNKGNEALIMRDNAMDLAYTNCQTES